jgi:hypothetical protein
MALSDLGLALLKLKFPDLRDGFDTSELFREMLASYAEAVHFRDILVRGTKTGQLSMSMILSVRDLRTM